MVGVCDSLALLADGAFSLIPSTKWLGRLVHFIMLEMSRLPNTPESRMEAIVHGKYSVMLPFITPPPQGVNNS